MDRTTWMTLKAYAPAAALLVVAFIALSAAKGLAGHPLSAAAFSMLRMVSLVAFGLALIALASATYRLWRWESGEGPMCPVCGGPLGSEKSGIKGRGGYRTCMQCGKHANERFYR